MLTKSKYNIIFNLHKSGNKVIANSLYGTADVLTPSEFEQYQNNDFADDSWRTSGYAVVPELEKKEFQKQYVDFLDNRESDETQLFFVPTYDCNFGCDYCYQHEYTPQQTTLEKEVIDAFFSYATTEFAGQKKYLTLFGGEPLLPGKTHYNNIEYFLSEAKRLKLETAIVTNGYQVVQYLPLLKNALIREIQVTLDGTQTIHNQRRPLKSGAGTFTEIVAGIDALIAAEIPVNLRMVLDNTNMAELPTLAQFAIDRGWTQSAGFKTQLGRNYELHTCQKNQQALYSRVQMYSDLAEVIAAHPHVLQFHQPSFHFVKSLTQDGEMPSPIFDSCPGCKTEWAFDYQGHIYSCTATVGKSGESLGTFYPAVTKNEEQIEQWQDRDILSIEKCTSCHLALVCGGGCGAIAKNQFGTLHSPDCRPVQELAEIGATIYFNNNDDAKRIK